jgi:threonine dehydrogenase-like Zn-dependent dehydrogenase
VRIQGSATYLPEDFQEAIELLLAAKVRPRDFITGTYALDDVADAFAASASGQHIKVIVTADRLD